MKLNSLANKAKYNNLQVKQWLIAFESKQSLSLFNDVELVVESHENKISSNGRELFWIPFINDMI